MQPGQLLQSGRAGWPLVYNRPTLAVSSTRATIVLAHIYISSCCSSNVSMHSATGLTARHVRLQVGLLALAGEVVHHDVAPVGRGRHSSAIFALMESEEDNKTASVKRLHRVCHCGMPDLSMRGFDTWRMCGWQAVYRQL